MAPGATRLASTAPGARCAESMTPGRMSRPSIDLSAISSVPTAPAAICPAATAPSAMSSVVIERGRDLATGPAGPRSPRGPPLRSASRAVANAFLAVRMVCSATVTGDAPKPGMATQTAKIAARSEMMKKRRKLGLPTRSHRPCQRALEALFVRFIHLMAKRSASSGSIWTPRTASICRNADRYPGGEADTGAARRSRSLTRRPREPRQLGGFDPTRRRSRL